MKNNQMEIFAFTGIQDEEPRSKIYEEIKQGRSRFGNFGAFRSLREEWNGKLAFLLSIKPRDWIVHLNSPTYNGACVAVQVNGEYTYDKGIFIDLYGNNGEYHYHHVIPVDPTSIIEFNRNDPNIIPTVNLRPRGGKYQRVHDVNGFLKSIEYIRTGKYSGISAQEKTQIHLLDKINEDILPKITQYVHEMNRSKDFEKFLYDIFDKMNVNSIQNGFGYKSDHGADIIVDFQIPIFGVSFETRIIVQAKSHTGRDNDTWAIDQIIEGIKKYNGHSGLLMTTGDKGEELVKYAAQKSKEISKPIDILAGNDIARFIIHHAPEKITGIYEI